MVASSKKTNDVVYFVKECTTNEELTYSLRSLDKNFPHKNVWIYGGCPQNVTNVNFVKVNQEGKTKWDKVNNMYRSVALNQDITEDFYLFNDDFYVINPVEEVPVAYRCSLPEHILLIEEKYHNMPTEYTKVLRSAYKDLRPIVGEVLSYELHIPILINRHKLLETLGAFPGAKCTRTRYGNLFHIGGTKMSDVKVFGRDFKDFDRGNAFLSSDDMSFKNNKDLVAFLKEKFPNKSCYEK